MTQVRVHVDGYPDSDDEERADLTSRLRDEMLERGVEDVAHPEGMAPDGAKGGALEWAQLVVGLAGSVGPMIAALRAWIGGHPRAAVTLEIDGDTLTLASASEEEQGRMIESFLARHGAG
jgi:membrane-associated two-gene conflict system component 1 (EACC1)